MFRASLSTGLFAFVILLGIATIGYSQPHSVSRGGGGSSSVSRGASSHSSGASRGAATRSGSSSAPHRVSSPSRGRATSTSPARTSTTRSSSPRSSSTPSSTRGNTNYRPQNTSNSPRRRTTTSSIPTRRPTTTTTTRRYPSHGSHYTRYNRGYYRPSYYGTTYAYGYGGWGVGYRIPRQWPSVYSPVYIYRDYDWYYTPRYTRPVSIYAPQTVVQYAQDDSLYWQGKIDTLRRELANEQQIAHYGDPAIEEILAYASSALDDANEMLRLGYGEEDIQAALDDASMMLQDARQERAIAQSAAQIFGTAQQPIDRSMNTAAYLQQTQPSTQGGDAVSRGIADAARTQAMYDAAAQRGQNAYASESATVATTTSSINQLIAEQRTLQDWLNELQKLADAWDRPASKAPLQQAQAKLTLAGEALNKKQEDRARDALNDATDALKTALQLLSPNQPQ